MIFGYHLLVQWIIWSCITESISGLEQNLLVPWFTEDTWTWSFSGFKEKNLILYRMSKALNFKVLELMFELNWWWQLMLSIFMDVYHHGWLIESGTQSLEHHLKKIMISLVSSPVLVVLVWSNTGLKWPFAYHLHYQWFLNEACAFFCLYKIRTLTRR